MGRFISTAIIVSFMLAAGHAEASECVVLLHGLARTAGSMAAFEKRLINEGYKVSNVGYPSRKLPIEKLARKAVKTGLAECENESASKIHFVTHSLGGILVRAFLKASQRADIGRVVMLGPPNQGSEVVDHFKGIPGFKLLNGPAGLQLGTMPTDMPKQLGPVNFELGVIAGTKSINLILSAFLPGPNDGKVSVESTKVDGMHDFIALPTAHPFMMKNKAVIGQTVHFLQHGRFTEAAP